MIAWTLSARRGRWIFAFLLAALGSSSGCSSVGKAHAAKRLPHPGIVDCNQPRELRMVSMPPHVVEPPDELEVTVKPTVADLPTTSLTVQADGNLDLGFLGDVYVAGLTLPQVEQKISQQLTAIAGKRPPSTGYMVSARLVNGNQSKSYYVLGTVTIQGKFPVTGNETVLDAILTAGLKSNSIPEKAYLVRPRPAGAPDQILKIDWIGIKERGDTLTNYQLFPGDRVIVPGGKPPGLIGSLIGG